MRRKSLLLALAMTGTILASWPWGQAYLGHAALLELMAIGIVAPLLWIGTSRQPIWISASASLLGAVLACMAATASLDPSTIVEGFMRAPAELLTEQVPVTTPSHLLVPAVIMTWVTGVVSAEVIIERDRAAFAGLIWFVSFSIATAATSSVGKWSLTNAILLSLLMAFMLWLPSWTTSTAEGTFWWTTAVGIAVLAASVGTGLFVAGRTDSAPAAVTRIPPLIEQHLQSPTYDFSRLRGLAPSIMWTGMSTSDNPISCKNSSCYLGGAFLDHFNGGTWSLADTFRPTGAVVSSALNRLVTGHSTSIEWTARGNLSEPWIPQLGLITQISGGQPAFQPISGGVLNLESIAKGATFTSVGYEVPAFGGESPSNGDQSANPILAAKGKQMAQALSGCGESTVFTSQCSSNLVTWSQDLHDRYWQFGSCFYLAKGCKKSGAPANAFSTSVSTVNQNVFTNHVASPEQFATVVALIARAEGYPTILVEGYRLPEPKGSGIVAMTSQSASWVLVGTGSGWRIIDPVPTRFKDKSTASLSEGGCGKNCPKPPPPIQLKECKVKDCPKLAGDLPEVGGTALTTMLLFGVAVVAAISLVALPASVAWRRRRRRGRRRAVDDPRLGAVGAWQELLDALDEASLRNLNASSAEEVLDRVDSRFGSATGTQLATTAEVANVALFSSMPIDIDRCDAAWAGLEAALADLGPMLTRWERIRRAIRIAPRKRT